MRAEEQKEYDVVNNAFEAGWVLDPDMYGGKPVRLENAVIYHLVQYESEDEKPVVEEEIEQEIISIQSVPINEADRLVQAGYVLKDTFAKTVTLVKYAEKEA